MIQNFRDRETEAVFHGLTSKRLSPSVLRAAMRKLLILDAAETLQDLASPPGNRLEKLRGSREGQHSVRVNDQWRICFRWERGNAYEVELTDYH
jgi:toxin HigB-1